MPDVGAKRPAGDKAARDAERARTNRLSRLPFLYDFALRGRTQAVLATLPQAALAVVLALVPIKLLSGQWLPAGAVIAVVGAALALQAGCRYLNARAGRR
ncbi:MAG: hypothetical protein LH469_10600 [Frankiaceae bacterium]|nr:hypothetical protein [Frankiaceae bacterium]